jgi:hypothetical protein
MVYSPFEMVGVVAKVAVAVGVGVCEGLSSILALVVATVVVNVRLGPFSTSSCCTGV